MSGRYGIDDLYKFSMVLFFALWLIEIIVLSIMPNSSTKTTISIIFSATTLSLVVWMMFRCMSRNHFKRRRENLAYLNVKRAIKRFFTFNTSKKSKSNNVDNSMYIFRDCTKCGSTLRLPRNPGKHRVKCPRCSHSFYVKSK